MGRRGPRSRSFNALETHGSPWHQLLQPDPPDPAMLALVITRSARSFFYHLDRSTLQLTPADFLIRKPATNFPSTNRSQRAGENIALRKQRALRFPYKLPV